MSYNEGWNIYNAMTVANHEMLYPVKYGWTTVNYPMLSFFLMAQLHRFTNDYLFTARAISLISVVGCGILVGLIVRSLTGSGYASVLSGFYCLAVFCTNGDPYVGADDPQMLSLMLFLAGLLLYLRRRDDPLNLVGVAGLFVVAGCVKHNPIDFPLAVSIDLWLISRRRAVWFSLCGLTMVGIALAWHIRFGGPYFLDQVMAPRDFSTIAALEKTGVNLGPLFLPLCVASYMGWFRCSDERQRIAGILLAASLAIGTLFSGGQGVTMNAHFGTMIAMTILLGICLDAMARGARMWRPLVADAALPLLLFGWLIVPMVVYDVWNPVKRLRETVAAERRFDQDVAFLRTRRGPALCESLLRCYFAGESYLYDPFNATRLIEFGKLDPGAAIAAIRQRQDAAIELEQPLAREYEGERFNPHILDAIKANYVPALAQDDSVILVPKPK